MPRGSSPHCCTDMNGHLIKPVLLESEDRGSSKTDLKSCQFKMNKNIKETNIKCNALSPCSHWRSQTELHISAFSISNCDHGLHMFQVAHFLLCAACYVHSEVRYRLTLYHRPSKYMHMNVYTRVAWIN